MKKLLAEIRVLLTPRDKWLAAGLVVLMGIGAGLELVGISVLMPVIAVLTKPELLEQNRCLAWCHRLIAPDSRERFLILMCGIIVAVFLLKNLFLLLLSDLQARYIYGLSARWSARLYGNYLRTGYEFHLHHGAPELLNNLGLLINVVNSLLLPAMLMLSEIIVIAAILAMLTAVMPGTTLLAGGATVIFATAVYLLFSRYNFRLGRELVGALAEVSRQQTQGLLGIKAVKTAGLENRFADQFRDAQSHRFQIERRLYFGGQVPRLAFEVLVIAAAMGLLAVFTCGQVAPGSILLTVALLAMAMFRLLPAFSRIQYNLIRIRQSMCSFDAVFQGLTGLRNELPEQPPAGTGFIFRDSLKLNRVTYTYPNAPRPVLRDFSAEFPYRSCTGVAGPTGSGKSTLTDLILGLLPPASGTITADGRDIREDLAGWRRKIGYIPQTIYLMDDSIRANVALGEPPAVIDDGRVAECLRLAQLETFVAGLPEGADTRVGDNGVRLSGGQRQRLGIARALYRNPEILIFDEATSALDNETEKRLIDALTSLKGKFTILMIAHRLNTLENCDRVIRIDR